MSRQLPDVSIQLHDLRELADILCEAPENAARVGVIANVIRDILITTLAEY